jgi:capsid protein
MTKLNDLDQFDRATLVKQKTGALLTGFITTPNENPLGAVKADDGVWTASPEPGTIQRLSPGESLEFSDPPDTGGYSDFAKTQLRLIASGLGLPYNILSGDLSDTSYSSARVGLIEFRKYIDALQWRSSTCSAAQCFSGGSNWKFSAAFSLPLTTALGTTSGTFPGLRPPCR